MGRQINATRGWNNVQGIRVGKALFPVDVRILGGPGCQLLIDMRGRYVQPYSSPSHSKPWQSLPVPTA
jgi:hypothetical protein